MPVFVNKKEITDDEIHREMQYHPATTVEDARREASRALIIRKLLLNATVEENILKAHQISTLEEDQEERAIETLLKKVIQVPVADQMSCKRYYELHKDHFRDKQSNELLPFKMVKKHIENYLDDKGHQAALHVYIDSLMDKAAIVGI